MLWDWFSHCQCLLFLYVWQGFILNPNSQSRDFKRLFPLVLPLLSKDNIGSHHGSIWNCRLPEAWKKRTNAPLVYTCIHPYAQSYDVWYGWVRPCVSVFLYGGKVRDRDVNISWSLIRHGFQFLEGSHWQCQPFKKWKYGGTYWVSRRLSMLPDKAL